MKPNYNLLSLAIISACISQYAQADLRQQCLLGVPQFQGELVQGDQTQQPIYIDADSATINQPTDATYSGNVNIKQGNRSLEAEQVRIELENQEASKAYLQGNFRYQDNLIQASGQDAAMDFTRKQAELRNADYQFVGRQGRGTAEAVAFDENIRTFKNASFTSCLPNNNAWSIEASEMKQYVKQEYAEMWHARFKILGVPVFYTPYLQMPIGDRRRSGLLMPNVASSGRDGFAYSQPIYWNIAPNYDATLTPTYYTRRGWQLSPEFRYLSAIGEGLVAGEYMQKDRLPEWKDKDKQRHLFFWRHNVGFLNNWRLNVDYTKVSDKRYFNDFSSLYGNSTDGYATQNFKLGYYQPNYNFSIAGKQFQVFDDIGVKPYRVLPQMDFNYYRNNVLKNVDFSLFSQISHFDNDSKQMPTAWRFHLEPKLSVPLAIQYGSLNLETKLYATQYLQKRGEDSKVGDTDYDIQRKVTRVIPQFKLELKSLLEADKQMVKGFSQTFEPRVQYLFRPYRDQSNIGSKRHSSYLGAGYDSALLQQDYYSIFRERAFSGLDRIASANQIAFGGTTRFFDDKTGDERFNFSAGQIYFLHPSRIDNDSLNSSTKGSSSWALESNWKIAQNWQWRGSYQYDTRLDETALANMTLEYRPAEMDFVQLNYRFASQHYIDQNLRGNTYSQDIKQIGAVASWQLSDRVAIMLSRYQDLALKKPVESQIALSYSNCCWAATAYAGRYLIPTPMGNSDGPRDVYYDNRFGINFELRGFSNNYGNGMNKMLKKGLIPYSTPFILY